MKSSELPFGTFLRFFFFQQGPRYFHVEKLDKRAHEKGRDDGADTHYGGHLPPRAAAQQENHRAEYDAHQIGADAHVLELAPLPFAGHDDGHGIVGGNAQIRRHIERRSEADDHDADEQTQRPHPQGGVRQQFLQIFVGKLGDVPQQKQVDERAIPMLCRSATRLKMSRMAFTMT